MRNGLCINLEPRPAAGGSGRAARQGELPSEILGGEIESHLLWWFAL